MSRQELINKWSEAKGKVSIGNIEDYDVKSNMAQLLENQKEKNIRAELLQETNVISTTTPTSEETGQWKPISLALVRRTFPDLFANKIVGVQAMNGPVGLAYALRFPYNTNNPDNHESAWDKVPEYSGYTGSLSGTSGTADAGTGATTTQGEGWQLPPTSPATMPQVKLTIEKTAIEAKTRKLAASYSLEAAQDIKAMHNIDIEREMLSVIQYELVAELDRELLQRVKTVAVDTSKGGEAATSFDVSASDGRWSQEKYSNLLTVIMKKINDIAIATRQGAGNFVVVSPRVATAIQAAAGKQFNAITGAVNPTTVFSEIGNINNVIKVYRDSYATSDYALCGFKGEGTSRAGVIYSPYITGLVNKTVSEEDFSPRMGVMSRYAITDSLLGAGRYYRQINFSNLDAVLGN